jgi:hypothetical protein
MDNAIQKLRELRSKAASINATLIDDLKPFFVPKYLVFRRLPSGSDEKGNVTNTCSCLMALAILDKGVEFFRQTLPISSDIAAREQITRIFEKSVTSVWTSSGLPDDNAFTSLIVLRTAGLLSESLLTTPALEMSHTTRIPSGKRFKKGVTRTLEQIAQEIGENAPESFKVDDYPATPGIAYWFVDAVENLIPDLGEEAWKGITLWSAQSFARQVSLVSAQHDAMKDPVAMALAACLATRLRKIISARSFNERDHMIQGLPTNIEVEQAVLNAFKYQEKSGIWPKYFPLFNYKAGGAGSNYLFSFEVLEVIVNEFENSDLLENEIVFRGFERALDWCESNRLTYVLEGTSYRGWNSGGQLKTLLQGKPEAWATATIHMFLHRLRSALSVLIKRGTLLKYGVSPTTSNQPNSREWENFIDSPVRLRVGDRDTTAKNLLQKQILDPIENEGRIGTRRSALLFGPPGTAKTSLVRAIAKKIGWPLVELNPSDFLKNGLENIYSQTDSIFSDLYDLWQSVVFFDEMDALARKRVQRLDVTRQFLTTSMLPKLSKLHDDARVLFFMATNHQRDFDDAIKRPGRFDLLVHMRPPTWADKIALLEKFWPGGKTEEEVAAVRRRLSMWVPPDHNLATILDLFTFGEFKSFLESIGKDHSLKTEIEKMDQEQFHEEVDKWGKNYIALHSAEDEQADTELSLLQEFEKDKEASSIQ